MVDVPVVNPMENMSLGRFAVDESARDEGFDDLKQPGDGYLPLHLP